MQCKNITIEAGDHYDSLTLAREHLDNAAVMFRAVAALIDTNNVRDARRLAMFGHTDAYIAADEFGTEASMMEVAQ